MPRQMQHATLTSCIGRLFFGETAVSLVNINALRALQVCRRTLFLSGVNPEIIWLPLLLSPPDESSIWELKIKQRSTFRSIFRVYWQFWMFLRLEIAPGTPTDRSALATFKQTTLFPATVARNAHKQYFSRRAKSDFYETSKPNI